MRVPTWLVAGLAVGGLLWQSRCQGKYEGELRAKVQARETAIAALAVQKARVDTVAGKSKAVAFDKAAAYQKLRDSIMAAIDTTDPIILPVVTIIRAADSSIATCHVALRDCGNAISVRDSQIAHLDTLLRLERTRARGCRVLGFLPCPRVSVGVNVDDRGLRPGLHVGIPLH